MCRVGGLFVVMEDFCLKYAVVDLYYGCDCRIATLEARIPTVIVLRCSPDLDWPDSESAPVRLLETLSVCMGAGLFFDDFVFVCVVL